jgi:hypothetical protein
MFFSVFSVRFVVRSFGLDHESSHSTNLFCLSW